MSACLPTYNQILTAYEKAPELLAERLIVIFSPMARVTKVKDGPDVMPVKMTYTEACVAGAGIHEEELAHLLEFCPDFELMLKNVAAAIIRTSKSNRTGEMESRERKTK